MVVDYCGPDDRRSRTASDGMIKSQLARTDDQTNKIQLNTHKKNEQKEASNKKWRDSWGMHAAVSG